MSLVADASVYVAALLDAGEAGRWAESRVRLASAAPHLVPAEVCSVLRRMERQGVLAPEETRAALQELRWLLPTLHPFAPLADRIWALRHNLTPYDAWYVALAERLQVPLATLDRRLAAAPAIRCPVELPPASPD